MVENKKCLIELRNVSVIRDEKTILSDINWRVKKGESCAVIGANGAGKSTLLSVIAGYMWATDGQVKVMGDEYGKVDLSEVREKLGMLGGSRIPAFPHWMSVEDVVATGFYGTIVLPPYEEITKVQEKKILKKLAIMGMEDFVYESFKDLSTGEQIRVLLARALAAKHELLLLDEPTAGLDLKARVSIIKALERLLKTKNPPAIVVVTHHLAELPGKLDSVMLLKNGKIFAQGKADAILTSKNLSHAYDCKVDVEIRNSRYTTVVHADEWKL